MINSSYHQLLKSTIEHSLLHLYFHIKASSSFVKEEQRNKIIIEFLKPKIKQTQYSLIKKKLKTICLMKNKFGSIERNLENVLDEYYSAEIKNDVDKLYSLLETLERNGLDTKLIEESPTKINDVVYLDRTHIDNCFNEENRQIKPISLFIRTNELNRFTKCLEKQDYFKFSESKIIEESDVYHYQLHPLSY
ncbi:TPA: DUF2913 family protein [Vibrio parahaemolyticus]|nr:DUF2913 family protein [Vibrio parahaemolyticus]HBC3383822.1 DUF2913 family protein [Vibrio parahaemolyticus]HBC3445547.1 DUF2913 family protein [Vibrio parahaemolyticus]HBC3845365.1 DUF2913 family protein [Vibrio parahaemolyticus]HBH7860445.1 DUF2913 family protein [Vibrio parahaemolyticus]